MEIATSQPALDSARQETVDGGVGSCFTLHVRRVMEEGSDPRPVEKNRGRHFYEMLCLIRMISV